MKGKEDERMIHSNKVTGRALSMPAGFAIATCISWGTTLVLSGILAKMISLEKLEWEKIGYGIVIMLLTTSMMGAKAACLMIKRRKLMACAIAGILYWTALLTISALFFGGQFSGIGVTGITILCGSAIVCILEMKGGRSKKMSSRRIGGANKLYR